MPTLHFVIRARSIASRFTPWFDLLRPACFYRGMPTLELPHTPGCMVCGRDNPAGLHLSLFVETETSVVQVRYTPLPQHIGFQGIVHGGVISTVIDEAMVWAATWAGKRFCLCGELSVRFRSPARIGRPLLCRASVETARSRLVQTLAELTDEAGNLVAEATGKYIPLDQDRNREFIATFVEKETTQETATALRAAM